MVIHVVFFLSSVQLKFMKIDATLKFKSWYFRKQNIIIEFQKEI